jgi:hypothetical protein
MTNGDYATKQDLQEVKQELKQDILNLAQRLERAETTMLREFRQYARMQVTRTQALESRMHELEQRVTDLETGGPERAWVSMGVNRQNVEARSDAYRGGFNVGTVDPPRPA